MIKHLDNMGCPLLDLFNNLLSAKGLQAKKIQTSDHTTEVTGFQLLNFLDSYYKLLISDKLHEPVSIMEANVTAHAQSTVESLKLNYNQVMKEHASADKSGTDIEDLHEAEKQIALDAFDAIFKNSPFENITSHYRNIVIDEIDSLLNLHKESRDHNEQTLKNAFLFHSRLAMDEFTNALEQGNGFEKAAAKAWKHMEDLQSHSVQYMSNKAQLKEKMKDRYAKHENKNRRMKLVNQGRLGDELRSALAEYSNAMQKTEECYVKECDLSKLHDKLRDATLTSFDSKKPSLQKGPPRHRQAYSDRAINRHREILQDEINMTFEDVKLRNEENKELIEGKRLFVQSEIVIDYQIYMGMATANQYVEPDVLASLHREFMEKLKNQHPETHECDITRIEAKYNDFKREMKKKRGIFRLVKSGEILPYAGKLLISTTFFAGAVAAAVLAPPSIPLLVGSVIAGLNLTKTGSALLAKLKGKDKLAKSLSF